MKFLVLGCNGMAGHIISIYLSENGHNVTGFAREQSRFVNTVIGDAADFALLKKTIFSANYDAVVNCVGLLNQVAENNHAQAVLLNGYLPHFLAQITESMDTQVIQISTDCVFSGARGGYTENDVPDGTLFYDKSKGIGELNDTKNITLRNSIVGPDIKERGIGLLNWFMKQSKPVYGYTGVKWTGQTTLQLARTIEIVARRRAYGLFNAVPSESITKYSLLCLFNQYIRKNPIEINPKDDFIVDKSLKRTNYNGFDDVIPGYEQMVKELGVWMRTHKGLYPHYEL